MENTKPITIAYIEDDPVVRAAYQNRLVKHGFQVHIAADGVEAMKLMGSLTPDVVLLDLMLPKFDGVDVFKFIRSKSHLRTVPVIILSTNTVIDVKQEYVLEQANKRLIKEHCNFATLLAAIHEFVPAARPQSDPAATAQNLSPETPALFNSKLVPA